MRTIEEVMRGLEYISKDDVENPVLTLEKMKLIHDSLDDENFMSYVMYMSLRPDLSEDERDTCLKLIKIKRALENRDVERNYSHFHTIEEGRY